MKIWQGLVGGVGAVVLLAGCGGSGFAEEPAGTVIDAAAKDMKELSSVRLVGDMTNDGEDVGFNLQVSKGGDCQGTLEMSGGEAELRSIDGTSWMRLDDAFWEAFAGDSAALAKGLVGDRWVLMPGDQGDFSEICDLEELLSGIDDDSDAEGKNEGAEEVDGQEAVKISTETDDGEPMTAWVAVGEPHHVLKMRVEEGDEPGTITFSDFDEELDLEKPADDEVVDLSTLGG